MQPSDLLQAPALIQTPRLRLTLPSADNAEALATVFLDSLNRSLPYLGFIAWAQSAHDADWAARFLQRDVEDIARGEVLVYYAFETGAADGDGAYVGRVDLHSWDFAVPRCEVGYVGEPLVSGRGLMREAVLACIDLALSLGAVRVQALSEAGNLRALRFAEQALGLQREGVLRHYERDAQGRLGEQVLFARVREDAR
jgi:RimJ/RimL family protein N-acetyltransferase